MPKVQKKHVVAHTADQMFALVADIERYPEFVPLCQALEIRSEREKANRRILVADMTAGYKAVRESFTCQVVLLEEERKIDVSYIDGPFKYLDNRWAFEPLDEATCTVIFDLDYEFKSLALAMLMGSMFDRAFAMFTKAFEDRANAIYGQSPSA